MHSSVGNKIKEKTEDLIRFCKEASRKMEYRQQLKEVRELVLSSNTKLCFSSFSFNVDKHIGNEGVSKLSEVLKTNSSLTSLDLCRKRVTAPFILTQYR
jgi:hypothetical protein